MLREHATNDILVDLDAKGVRDLLRDAQLAEFGVAEFHLQDCRDELRSTKARWNLSNVAGLISAPSLRIRRGFMNSVMSPIRRRSGVLSLRARRLDRSLIRS